MKGPWICASWGKGLVLHLVDGTVAPFTSGHRNPQGLYVDPNGVIWSTEHGPEGGDELDKWLGLDHSGLIGELVFRIPPGTPVEAGLSWIVDFEKDFIGIVIFC